MAKFKPGRTSLEDEPFEEPSKGASINKNVEKVYNMILNFIKIVKSCRHHYCLCPLMNCEYQLINRKTFSHSSGGSSALRMNFVMSSGNQQNIGDPLFPRFMNHKW